MIVYRCVCCFKKYFSAEVLICSVCNGDEFLKENLNMAHPESALPPLPQPTNSSGKSTNRIGEVKIPAIGNSPCQREEVSSVGEDFIFPYEDSAVNEFYRKEDVEASSLRSQNILLEQEQLLKNCSKNYTAMNTFSPGIQNAWCQTQTSHVQNIEAETPSYFNYLADSFSASPAKPHHLMNFHHQSSKHERENQSSLEKMLEKQITVKSSQIKNKNSEIELAVSSRSPPDSCISHFVTENVFDKNKFRDTNEKGGNSSDPLNKRRNSSTENFFPEDLGREKEVSNKKARTSQQKRRIEGRENYRRNRAPTSKKGLKCWKCRKGFANESELNIHMQNPCEQMPNKTDQCPQEFSNDCRVNEVPEEEAHNSQRQTRTDGRENALRKLASRSKKGFKCWNCRKGFTYVSELHIHMQNPCEPKLGKPIPGELNQYKCGECSEEFSHEWKLEEHLVVHWEVKPFECEHCDLAFKWEKTLTLHMKKYHESEMEAYFSDQESKNEFKCVMCSRKFTSESELNNHWQQNNCDPNNFK
ncbi:hypothetical protein AVEN_4649-1 [Araneus ventricosus]|uniref:C2H2-type domain-containing protein n=1 Tax=Araneus ventricosus TaxID=182803 RepID=A0A4Y2UI99_ARAVE|nr:hypothetical protein AVEN_4649-1 [Araneus ventricosus]